jgi:hypothetical protein
LSSHARDLPLPSSAGLPHTKNYTRFTVAFPLILAERSVCLLFKVISGHNATQIRVNLTHRFRRSHACSFKEGAGRFQATIASHGAHFSDLRMKIGPPRGPGPSSPTEEPFPSYWKPAAWMPKVDQLNRRCHVIFIPVSSKKRICADTDLYYQTYRTMNLKVRAEATDLPRVPEGLSS